MQESTFEDVFIVNKTESNFQALETFLKLDTEEEEIELSEIEANFLQVNEVLSSKILKAETFNVDFSPKEVVVSNNFLPKKVKGNASKKNNCQNSNESLENNKCNEKRRIGPILNSVSRLINIDQSFKYNF